MSSLIPELDPPLPPQKKGLHYLAQFAIAFVASCLVVVGAVVMEVAQYSKSRNDGIHENTYQLLTLSLVVSFVFVFVYSLKRRFANALAVLIGILPVILLSWFIYEADGWGPKLPYRIRSHTDSTDSTASANIISSPSERPSLMSKNRDPGLGDAYGYGVLSDSLSQYVTRALGSKVPSGRVIVSFVVGPRGGLYQGKIEEHLTPKADSTVLAGLHQLPRLRPGRVNGQGVPVLVTISLRLPAPNQRKKPSQ